MKKISFFVIILSLCFSCQEQKATKILFIGNSLTFYNEMPEMLQNMFDEKGLDIEVSQATFPGYTLQSHLNTMIINEADDLTYTREKIKGELTPTELILDSDTVFNHIVLQERTGLATIEDIRQHETMKNIAQIKAKAKGNPTIWLYQNFPTSQPYPKVFCKMNKLEQKVCSDTIRNINEEISEIKTAFEELANGNRVVTIGESYTKVLLKHKNIDLYSDETHPSKLGSFLIALNFYSCFTKENPEELAYNAGLNMKETKILKNLVAELNNCN